MHLSDDGIVSQLCNNRTCMHIDLVLLQLLALDGGKYSSELAYWFPRIANIKRFQLRRPTYSWEVLSIPTYVPRNGWVKWWWWESLYNTVPQHMHTAKGCWVGRRKHLSTTDGNGRSAPPFDFEQQSCWDLRWLSSISSVIFHFIPGIYGAACIRFFDDGCFEVL